MNNSEGDLLKSEVSLIRVTNTYLVNNNRPECDVTSDMNETNSSYYASLIGILRWVFEMGRVDILCEVSMMSSYVYMPI